MNNSPKPLPSQTPARQTHSYSALKIHVAAKLDARGTSKGIRQNYLTALNSWMRLLALRDESLVGVEMTSEFDRYWTKVMDELRIGELSPRTIQDRCELMLQWKDFFAEMGEVDSLPKGFSEALVEAMRRGGMGTGDVARASGIEIGRLRTWETGAHAPNGSRIDDLGALEESLRLKAGTLSGRLGLSGLTWATARANARAGAVTRTAYGERMSALGRARLGYIRWPEGRLRTQWQQVIAYKADALREDAEPGNTWRLKALRDTGARLSHANVINGMVCSAADASWSFIGPYLGWLTLSEEHGGCGLVQERVTSLAWLLCHDKLFNYLNWRQRRSGVVHKGMLQVLTNCCMFLRPESGWVWKNARLAETMEPVDRVVNPEGYNATELEAAWREKCAEVHAVYMERAKRISSKGMLKRSRDVTEPIRDILSERRPLQVVMSMIAKLQRMPPPASALGARAVWLRDLLLLKMLASNPLRVSHFSVMRYSSDQRGNLYKKADGSWALRFLASDFKNEKHAAQEDYDADIPPSIWPTIEGYLADGRPFLGGTSSEYVFLRAKCGVQTKPDGVEGGEKVREGMWLSENISHRIGSLTAMLRPGYPGFRSHAFRHIVGTDFLKRNPGAYVHVAHLLHDKLSTVMNVYGHLAVQDGLDRHFESFESDWNEAIAK